MAKAYTDHNVRIRHSHAMRFGIDRILAYPTEYCLNLHRSFSQLQLEYFGADNKPVDKCFLYPYPQSAARFQTEMNYTAADSKSK